MKKFNLITIVLIALVLVSCADVTTIDLCTEGITPYGFWSGLWHGMVAPISFIGQLFSDNIAIYAVNNNGGWYDFGFVWGSGIIFGGGTKLTSK